MLKNFYSNLSALGKNLFYAAVAIWVLALFDVLFLRPIMMKLKSLDSEIHEKANSIQSDMRFISYQDKIFKERKDFSVYQSGESATEEEIIAGFLKTVELLASGANINLIKLNPSDVVSKKGYIQYFADLECDGPLTAVITFMHRINTTDNLLKIVKFNMAEKRATVDEVKATMRISKLIIDLESIGDYSFPGEDQKDGKKSEEPALAGKKIESSKEE